jgi:bifunctional non-homologous end joining protein LigD
MGLSASFVVNFTLREMPKTAFPSCVPPMMAESTKAPFDARDWIFEIKLDGYRAITVFDSAGKPHLWSRNGLPLEAKFPAVANAVSKLKLRSTILDGEVVAIDENGIPDFSCCKDSRSNRRRRPFTMSSMSSGIRAKISLVSRSLSAERC